ncbi:hypothetical protein E4U14_008083 [Claviceps sp. LM454 group G7]|nr:hypothetical protein E4U14_008083 [Claviceps sp. LM454 group G7]
MDRETDDDDDDDLKDESASLYTSDELYISTTQAPADHPRPRLQRFASARHVPGDTLHGLRAAAVWIQADERDGR